MQNSMVLFTFSVFDRKHFLDKFDPKNQNCQFKLKFGTQTNSNMQNSMVVFIFLCFRPETHFLGKVGSKNQNCQFKLKFRTQTNVNMENSFCFGPEKAFLGKFGPKSQNCQFKLIFATQSNSNIQNSMVLFTFSVLQRKHTFWTNLVERSKLLV